MDSMKIWIISINFYYLDKNHIRIFNSENSIMSLNQLINKYMYLKNMDVWSISTFLAMVLSSIACFHCFKIEICGGLNIVNNLSSIQVLYI